MRILHLVSTLHAGGIASSLVQALPRLQRPPWLSVEVATLYRAGVHAERLRRAGVPVHELQVEGRYRRSAWRRLRELLEVGHFDALHAHGWPDLLIAATVRAPKGRRLHRIASEHNVTNRRRKPLFRPFDRPLYRRLDRVVAVSGAVAESLGAWHPEVRPRIRTVSNGLEVPELPPRAEFRRRLDLPADRAVLLAPGGGDPKKGLDVLAAAWNKVHWPSGSAPLLLVAGEDPTRVETLVREHSVPEEDVRILGWQEDFLPWIRAADRLVLPSRREGCPMVVLEAMALGTPVLAAAVGGVPELLDGGRAGELVGSGEPDAWATALGESLADPDGAAERTERACRRVAEEYSADSMARGLRDVLAELAPGLEELDVGGSAGTEPGPHRLTIALDHLSEVLSEPGTQPQERWSRLIGDDSVPMFWPSVAWAAGATGVELSGEAARKIRGVRLQTSAVGLFQEHGLGRVLDAFRSADLPVLVHKGALWSRTLYPSPEARGMRDVDLLVPRDRAEEARGLLEDLDYVCEDQALDPEGCLDLDSKSIALFEHAEKRGPGIDLHWRLSNVAWLSRVFRLDDLPLVEDGRTVALGDREVLALSLEDQILHMAMHQTVKHHFVDPRGYLDLDLLLGDPALDWERLEERARRAGLRSALWWATRVCRGLFATPVPSAWWEGLRPSAWRRAATRRVVWIPPSKKGARGVFFPTRLSTVRRGFLLDLLLADGAGPLLRGLRAVVWPDREWLEGRMRRAGVETRFPRLWHLSRPFRRVEVVSSEADQRPLEG